MESNHRSLGVDQASLPLDHGTVTLVESPGIAPGSLDCGTSVFLLDHDPMFWERKPDHRWAAVPARTHKRHFCHRLPSKQGPQPIRMTSIAQAEAVRFELTSGSSPPPVFRTGPSANSDGFRCLKLRRLESNQHEDVQSVSSCR